MDDTALERVSIATGLVASLAVGVPVALESSFGAGTLAGTAPGWWWAAYLVHLATLLGFDVLPARLVPLDARVLLAVQVLAGLVVFGLSMSFGFSAVLLVVSAASAAYVLGTRGAAWVVALQTGVVAVLLVAGDVGWTEMLLMTMVYGSFQAFAMLVVTGQVREAAARERLAEVNTQLEAAQAMLAADSRNEERLRIARELHDLVGHQLTALTLNLEVATHQHGPAQQAAVDRARGLAKELLGDVRAAVGELRHPAPSVRAAVEAIALQVPRPHVHVEVDDDVAVDPERAAALVRCLQEMVTNAVRHSDADNLWLRIEQDPTGTLTVSARDDGRGADRVVAGNGLTGMGERLGALGGELQWTTGPQQGFALAARLPATAAP
ncbi:sensor histidine kinase [Egicoccus halophilus]|uniref:sensor histidine kinase n=1 Tax=Egicoccus halophilus TaxID=1670830 RepID=UPI00102F63AD|nr:sensor histidine kinase [Egicoccus halophilus]